MIETIAALRPTWKNGASERQWNSDLRLYIGPALGSARIDQVTTADLYSLDRADMDGETTYCRTAPL